MVIDISLKNNINNFITESILERDMALLECKYNTILEMDYVINEEGLVSKIKDVIKQFIEKAVDYIKSVYTKFKNWIQSCKSKIKEIKETKNYIKDLYQSLSDFESSWDNIFFEMDDSSDFKSNADSIMNDIKSGMKDFTEEASKYTHEFEKDMKNSKYWDPDIIPSTPSYHFESSRFK